MNETAKKWKDTAAETFYSKSEGLSFFGMSENDFVRQTQSAQDWLDGLLKVWTDGEKESDEIVSHWTESFKSLTASTREELQALKDTADQAGYTGVSEQLAADIETLDSLDAEIEALLRSARTATSRGRIRSACRNSSTRGKPSRSSITSCPLTWTASIPSARSWKQKWREHRRAARETRT